MENNETNLGASVDEAPVGETTELVRSGIADGKSDAADAAKKFYGTMSKVLGKTAYGLSYYSAYGAAFAAALVRETMSESMKDGFSDGAKAGGEAAEAALQRMKERLAKTQDHGAGEACGEAPVPESA